MSTIEIVEEILITLASEFTKDDIVDVLFNDPIGSIEGASTLWTTSFL